MRYQIVLQWSAPSLADYDEAIAVENLLIERLTKQCEVDGHDFGSIQANIFIHVDDPHEAFDELRTILSEHKLWSKARIAYRQINEDEYKTLWCHGATTFRVS